MAEQERRSMKRQRILRCVLIGSGLAAVGLGAVGVVLPLLPTTPFLLLAAACFIRSSDRLYRRLIRNRLLGDYILNYREHHGMTLRAKLCALTLLWIVIGYSALTAADSWWLRGFLAAVAVGVTIHLLCLRTLGARGRSARSAVIPEGEKANRSGAADAFDAGEPAGHFRRSGRREGGEASMAAHV